MNNKMNSVWVLTKRNMKTYFRDKAAIFFSFLSPMIVLFIFILFLNKVQINSVKDTLSKVPGFVFNEKLTSVFVNSWLITGVLAVSIMTIALGACVILVNDKKNKVYNDFMVSPVNKSNITISYFLAVFLITLIVSTCLLLLSFIYLLIIGASFPSFLTFLSIIGTLILSCASATIILVFFSSFISSEGAFSSLNVIIGTVAGFLTGSYMPVSMFPTPIQVIANLVPGSYSACLFRKCFMAVPLQDLTKGMPAETVSGLTNAFSIDLYFVNFKIPTYLLAVLLFASVAIFFILSLFRFKNVNKVKS